MKQLTCTIDNVKRNRIYQVIEYEMVSEADARVKKTRAPRQHMETKCVVSNRRLLTYTLGNSQKWDHRAKRGSMLYVRSRCTLPLWNTGRAV